MSPDWCLTVSLPALSRQSIAYSAQNPNLSDSILDIKPKDIHNIPIQILKPKEVYRISNIPMYPPASSNMAGKSPHSLGSPTTERIIDFCWIFVIMFDHRGVKPIVVSKRLQLCPSINPYPEVSENLCHISPVRSIL